MFHVTSVRGNSVRVNVAGVLTFDVRVETREDGRRIVVKPPDLFISGNVYDEFLKAVLNAFELVERSHSYEPVNN